MSAGFVDYIKHVIKKLSESSIIQIWESLECILKEEERAKYRIGKVYLYHSSILSYL